MKIEHDPETGCNGCPLFEIRTGTAHGPHDVYTWGECRAGTKNPSGGRPAPAECPLRTDYVLIVRPT